MQGIVSAANPLAEDGTVLVMWRQDHAVRAGHAPVARAAESHTHAVLRDLGEGQVVRIAHLDDSAIFDAIRLKLTLTKEGRIGLRFAEMYAIVAGHQPQVRHRGQIVLARRRRSPAGRTGPVAGPNCRIRGSRAAVRSSTGNEVVPGFCSGRSATRSRSHVLPAKRNTPGLSRHSILMPGTLAQMLMGQRIGFSGKRFARSDMISIHFDDRR